MSRRYRRDDQDFVENLSSRMCHYTIKNIPVFEEKLMKSSDLQSMFCINNTNSQQLFLMSQAHFAVKKSEELHKAVCILFFGGPALVLQ